MFGLFKKKVKESETFQDKNYEFTWLEIDEHNPFNKRILDIRSFTQHTLSFTSDKYVAELFLKRRPGIGQELIDTEIPGSKTINVSLIYPHNGLKIEGAGYRAKCMEDKWDIYGWNNIIYLTRSWTGEVIYKLHIHITDTSFEVQKIAYKLDDYNKNDQSLVANNVHFLLKTLAFGVTYPHKVPAVLTSEKEIALYSFGQFGHNCWYATYHDVLDAVVKN